MYGWCTHHCKSPKWWWWISNWLLLAFFSLSACCGWQKHTQIHNIVTLSLSKRGLVTLPVSIPYTQPASGDCWCIPWNTHHWIYLAANAALLALNPAVKKDNISDYIPFMEQEKEGFWHPCQHKVYSLDPNHDTFFDLFQSILCSILFSWHGSNFVKAIEPLITFGLCITITSHTSKISQCK